MPAPNFDDWNQLEEEEDDLQDDSFFENKRDIVLFCIDCSPSMHELYEDPDYEDQKTCHLFSALNAAVQTQRKKIITGPNDQVGILLFNTTLTTKVSQGQGSEIKNGTCLYQPIAPLSAETIKGTMRLLDRFREDHSLLEHTMPPMKTGRAAMGDVFTSCNWVIRNDAPKTATKRIFLITDVDNPHPGLKQLVTPAKTTVDDLTKAGVTVEPFFISTDQNPFNIDLFYKGVLENRLVDEEGLDPSNPSVLSESVSITRIDDLMSQMRFREAPKRALFSVPFELGKDFTIGVKGYGLVTEQKKSTYKYFQDNGDQMLLANTHTTFLQEAGDAGITKDKVVYGIDVGKVVARDTDIDMEADDDEKVIPNARVVPRGRRPYYNAEDIKEFRTLGLQPGLKLLGFKPADQLRFEDNIKHSLFVYPDETSFNGSKRTFSALIKSMSSKKKIGIARGLTRRNATPLFFALLPQLEKVDANGWPEPGGLHLIPLPFDDDLREKPLKESIPASDELVEQAARWIKKLASKKGYNPDNFPNPALAFHNAQLEAAAFREPFDPEDFEDLTKPSHDSHHKKAGKLIQEWKQTLEDDPSSQMVVAAPAKKAGTKRKAEPTASAFDENEMRERSEAGTLAKMTVNQLKDFLRSKALHVSGNKGDLIDRIMVWLESN